VYPTVGAKTLKRFLIFLSVLILQSVGCWSRPAEKQKLALPSLFARPLITGASVSANHGTASPGRRLALRFGADQKIKTAAFSGKPGREIEPQLTDDLMSDRSVILALDFFFWDSTIRASQPSLDAIDNLMKKAASHEVPIVLGDIPELLPFRQPARKELNRHLRRACESYARCTLLELDGLHQQLQRDGFIEMEGKKRTLSDIVPDGLHLSEVAANYLADFIVETIQK